MKIIRITSLACLLVMSGHCLGVERLSLPPLKLDKDATGKPTAAEIACFKTHVAAIPLAPDNYRNAMVYGANGDAVEACGTLYELTGDKEILDRMLTFTDAMLASRNNTETGSTTWTGKREPTWPNGKETSPGINPTVSVEAGDIGGHIAYAALLILQHEDLWKQTVPDSDPHHFGATYLDRAKKYVKEIDLTNDTYVIPHYVAKDTHREYVPAELAKNNKHQPDNPSGNPVPWNQQSMLNNSFLRLAQCHVILKDAPDRVKLYDTIVQASVDWFFSSVRKVESKGHTCYGWDYIYSPGKHYDETYGHGEYSMNGMYRYYRSGRYGITTEMMTPFANTVLYVMRADDGTFINSVTGDSNERRQTNLRGYWIELSEFSPALYPILEKASEPRLKGDALTFAFTLWARNRIAAATPASASTEK